MDIISTEINNGGHRIFYQTLMTMTFSLNTGHQYHYILKLMIYIIIHLWMLLLTVIPGYICWIEKSTLSISAILELLQHAIAGIYYSLIFIVLLFNKKAIISNYKMIETDFIRWSNKNKMNENYAYERTIHTIKSLIIPFVLTISFMLFGPLLSLIIDIGKLPLDHRSHFLLFWPKIIQINELITYGIIFSLQSGLTIILFLSFASFNAGIIMICNELNSQYLMLLDEIGNAFNYKTDEQFKKHFIDCINHHRLIIEFINDFKSYFKWIIFINIICVQSILAVCIYLWIKTNSSFGYKVKLLGTLIFNLCPFCFYCHIGQTILNMHTNLSNHLYNMAWYEMSNKSKQLIILMLQRTQKNVLISLDFFSTTVSLLLISQIMKQTYSILNVLLKT